MEVNRAELQYQAQPMYGAVSGKITQITTLILLVFNSCYYIQGVLQSYDSLVKEKETTAPLKSLKGVVGYWKNMAAYV